MSLPAQAQRSRIIRTFEILTPNGDTYQFPPAPRLQRLINFLVSQAETAIVSGIVFGMVYSAGVLVETLGPLPPENCKN
jgi:hypothetical protein